ncbi:hypothetical protein AEQ18_05480 [Enterococcus sp. RIT-PI-f]|nr:hypothetical protein AEQ18_05480 [Enterococcus sp. RIT-PI-f]
MPKEIPANNKRTYAFETHYYELIPSPEHVHFHFAHIVLTENLFQKDAPCKTETIMLLYKCKR